MLLLVVSVAVLAASCGVVFGLREMVRDAAEAARARLRAQIVGERPLALDGDPFGAFTLQGDVDGLPVTLENRATRTLPGASDEDGARAVCAVSFSLPAPDLIACRGDDVDRVMGPMPSHPRTPTGDARFDGGYRLFLGGARDEQASGSYRAAPADPLARWARASLFARMCDLELQWLRVRDGRAELVFPPLSAEDVPRALGVAAAMAHALDDGPVRPIVAGRRVDPVVPDAKGPSPWGVFAVLVFTGPLGAALGFLPALRELNEEDFCGPGGRILVSSSESDGGTSYGLYCSNAHDASLLLHYAGALALFLAVLGVLRALIAIPTARGQRAALAGLARG